MSKLPIKRLDSTTENDTAATALINDNFKAVQDAIENTLSRDGTVPNYMDADLDMNSYRIINTADPKEDTDLINLKYFKEQVGNAAEYSQQAEQAATRAQRSAENAQQLAASASRSAQEAAQSVKDAVEAAADENVVAVGTDLRLGRKSEIRKANANKANIDTVAGSIANVNTAATNINNINNVAANKANINTVAGSIGNVNKVGKDITNVNTAATNINNIKAVAANKTNIDTVATNIDDVKAVRQNINNVNTVASDIANVNTVAANKANIDNVATNMDDVKAAVVSAANAKESEENAKIWTEGTDQEVAEIGGVHSAKGWANLAGAIVSLDEATETTPGIIRIATQEEADAGMNNTAAITPSKLVKGLADYVGKGNVLGFNGTLEGNTLTFEPDISSYTLKNDYDYEIDLLFQAAGVLPDATKVIIKNGIDTINIVNVKHSDYSQPITYGELKQVCRYDENIGWRWVFNARYKAADGVKAFIMPSTVVNVAGDAVYDKIQDYIVKNPNLIQYESSSSSIKIKAGSTLIFPNGVNWDEVKITTDITQTAIPDHEQVLFTDGESIFYIDDGQVFAQATAPSGYQMMLWYDTSANIIKYSRDRGASWKGKYALPIAIADSTGIKHCFCNAMGYLAGTFWVADGLALLMPNGKNDDGSYKNFQYTFSKPKTVTYTDTFEGYLFVDQYGNFSRATDYTVTKDNKILISGSEKVVCPLGKFKITSRRIDYFEQRNILKLATEEDLTALNNTVQTEIQPKIDKLSTQINNVSSSLTKIQPKIDELSTQINNVSSSLTNSINNKIIVVSAVPDPARANTLYCIPE
jgi:hypothetical protein